MAIFTRDGHGQLERNRVNPVNMESQCVLDATAFPNGADVGTLVSVDKANGKLVAPQEGLVAGILANSERVFGIVDRSLKNYFVKPNEMGSVLFLEKGDLFTTNSMTIASAYSDVAALKADVLAGQAHAGFDATGRINVFKGATTAGIATSLKVVKVTTMPDGQFALQFMVLSTDFSAAN